MKKQLIMVSILAVSIGLLTACGTAATNELNKNDNNKAQAKVEPQQQAPKQDDKKQDIWTYYNNAKWNEDFNGLKMEIQKVVVSDKSPKLPTDKSEGQNSSLVGIKFKMENTTKGKFTTYPDQAKLVTSTGEQLEADMFVSDHLGGEIDEGVIKEGNIIWMLKRGHAEDIKWVKFEWTGHQGADTDFNSQTKTFTVKLDLNK